jgi:hypothetical protein
MARHRELRAWLVALVMLALLVLCAAQLVTTVRDENVCWDAGYELPVHYAGEMWCFGRDGEGVVVALADVR